MTITEHVYAPADRRKALADLADDWDDTGESVREMRLADLAHPSLAAWEIASAWSEYLDARRVAADLAGGRMSWTDWDPAYTCADRQAAAAEEAAMWAASVLDVLVNGGSKHD